MIAVTKSDQKCLTKKDFCPLFASKKKIPHSKHQLLSLPQAHGWEEFFSGTQNAESTCGLKPSDSGEYWLRLSHEILREEKRYEGCSMITVFSV